MRQSTVAGYFFDRFKRKIGVRLKLWRYRLYAVEMLTVMGLDRLHNV